MNFNGIIIAAMTILIIGVFHPLVIKAEYHFSKKVWPVFAAAGSIFIVISLFVYDGTVSPVLAIIGASCMWSIRELFEQEERVKKGLFPKKTGSAKRTVSIDLLKAKEHIKI